MGVHVKHNFSLKFIRGSRIRARNLGGRHRGTSGQPDVRASRGRLPRRARAHGPRPSQPRESSFGRRALRCPKPNLAIDGSLESQIIVQWHSSARFPHPNFSLYWEPVPALGKACLFPFVSESYFVFLVWRLHIMLYVLPRIFFVCWESSKLIA